jgi:phosphate transport system permease protein
LFHGTHAVNSACVPIPARDRLVLSLAEIGWFFESGKHTVQAFVETCEEQRTTHNRILMSDTTNSFTGRRRSRSTHWSIKFKDRVAKAAITIGGLGTIVAVSTVCLFLISVVIPLFWEPSVEKTGSVRLPVPDGYDFNVPVHVATDEYNLMAWSVFPNGTVRKFRLDNGALLDEVSLASEDISLTAWSFPQRDDLAVFGYSDGSVRYANIGFNLRFLELADAPAAYQSLGVWEIATYEKGLVQRTPENQLRYVTLSVELQDPVATGVQEPVVQLDHTGSRHEVSYAAMTSSGRIFVQRARSRRNLLTGATTYRITTGEVAYSAREALPRYLSLTGLGDNLYVIWEDGLLTRFDTRDYSAISLVETVDISPSPGVRVTAIGNMIGKTTLLVGDSEGTVRGWFRVRPLDVSDNPDLTVSMRAVALDAAGVNRGDVVEVRVADIQNADELALVPVKHLPGPASRLPVRSFAASQRKRMFAAGHDGGLIRVHNATVQRTLFEVVLPSRESIARTVLSPRDDGLVGVAGSEIGLWHLNVPHSEATWGAYFRPIWYEGYAEPRHVWQSTGGTDDFESKLGIMPLVFGTVKATFYSMLFAIPLALLAAIFTSEFLHPRVKMKVKPAIEMMASLPSVVLGFLAGLVLAQYVETRVPAVLMGFLTIPFALVLSACSWQLLSRRLQIRFQHARFVLMVLAIPVGFWLAGVLGPVFEKTFFSVHILNEEVAAQLVSEIAESDVEYSSGAVVIRDFRTWLSAHRQDPANPSFKSSPTGGWMILFAPLSILLTAFGMIRFGNPWLQTVGSKWSRTQFALMDMVKFVAGSILALFLAWVISSMLGIFWDPRGSYIDQYVQRNALVVGFIMGFAVVPIIYTIADDAMSAVPEHLRSASLGCGATRWQTAVRIIIPTAMSGLFSAIMIGFGRAVGETMIVLMAAGNTPIMEWNIFSGFRTLSANIAVEMMEAVEGSTNYRTLFLAAVILFSLTFAINTVAESIRQRYRKRAYQL